MYDGFTLYFFTCLCKTDANSSGEKGAIHKLNMYSTNYINSNSTACLLCLVDYWRLEFMH